MEKDEISRTSRIFNALGNETRMKTLILLSETKRPLHIKAIAEALQVDYAALYRHIKVLQQSSLLEVYDVGRSRVLSLKNKELLAELIKIANTMMQSS